MNGREGLDFHIVLEVIYPPSTLTDFLACKHIRTTHTGLRLAIAEHLRAKTEVWSSLLLLLKWRCSRTSTVMIERKAQ